MLECKKRQGTLPGAFPKDPKRCDPHYSNSELEWLVRDPPERRYLRHSRKRDGNSGVEDVFLDRTEALAIYGLMIRIEPSHPGFLAENSWWDWENDPTLRNMPRPSRPPPPPSPPPPPLPLPPPPQPQTPIPQMEEKSILMQFLVFF